MARRRRSKRANSGVQLVQIMGLVLVLVMILLFRDQIGDGAGALFGSFDAEDVRLPEEEAVEEPAPHSDTNTPD